jgi:putative membrane protein
MILPGISGSFLLVLLGMYSAVLAAVDDRELGILIVFALGAVLGLALFSQVLHRALSKYYDTVMAVLIGLMAGSTRVLWPWPNGLDSTVIDGPDEFVLEAVLLAVAAAAIVIGLTEASRRIEQRSRAQRADELQS